MDEKIRTIKSEIEDIEHSQFYLQMKDRWNNDDFRIDDVYNNRLRELKEKLKEMEDVNE